MLFSLLFFNFFIIGIKLDNIYKVKSNINTPKCKGTTILSATLSTLSQPFHRRRTGRGRGGACLPTFLQMVFFYMRTTGISNQKSQADADMHAANIAFDLFNIFLYVIARKVRKCPLSLFVTITLFCRVLCEWQTFWRDLHKRQTACLLYN